MEVLVITKSTERPCAVIAEGSLNTMFVAPSSVKSKDLAVVALVNVNELGLIVSAATTPRLATKSKDMKAIDKSVLAFILCCNSTITLLFKCFDLGLG